MNQPIRVGIIRCDLHAIYFANLMQTHDPLLLRDPAIGLGGYFYFYTKHNAPAKLMFPMVPGFELVKVWDNDRGRAENMVRIYDSRPRVCDRFEDVSDDVDLVLIADCSLEGHDKLTLATPGIVKGVPTFIDKPLAYHAADACQIVDLARKHGTPIMSISILRELPHAARFRDRMAEVGQPDFALIKGGTYTMDGLIHSVSLALHLWGPGIESVESMGGDGKPFVMHLDYGGKAGKPSHGVVINNDAGPTYHCAFYASAFSGEGAIHSDHLSDWEFPWGVIEIIKKIRKMVETRQPQFPYEEMIEGVAIATAARQSLTQRRRVPLREVWPSPE